MPDIAVVNEKNEKVGSLGLPDSLFENVGSTHVVWEVVRHHLAAQRRGTAKTKTRAMVSGGGKKPWRQKGTGRARVGSSRNPLWRHGGTTQGPKPRNHDYPISKKKRRVAARRVLASMVQGERVTVLDQLRLAEPKTRAMTSLLGGLGLRGSALVLVEGADDNLKRATGNLARIKVVEPSAVNAYDMLKYRHLLASKDALSKLAENLEP
jgi:large subunit ribosomal protein L4